VLSYVGTAARLTCVTGGKSLDNLAHTTDGSTVGQWTTNSSSNQLWTLQAQGNGYYKVVNVANGKCLDTGGSAADGGVMEFFTSGSSSNQQWRFVTP
jgi:arabinan endo-1,5-alpha-L-arabinosidase